MLDTYWFSQANTMTQSYSKEETIQKHAIKPPVSVCHQVSDIGHLDSPTTLKYHMAQLKVIDKWMINRFGNFK